MIGRRQVFAAVLALARTRSSRKIRRSELNIADSGRGTYSISGGTLQTLTNSPIVVGQWQNGVGNLNVSGTGRVIATGDLIVANGDTVNAPIVTGTVTQTGGTVSIGGRLYLANASQANGTYRLQGGVLDLMNHNIDKGAGTATFEFSGGTLQNANTINLAINQQGGTLAPGAVAAAGTTTINGDYTLSLAGTLQMDLLSSAAFDVLNVNGLVNLGGNLGVNAPAGLAQGSSFFILNNDNVDANVGFFLGKPEGAVFGAGGNTFRISYVAGDGNDVRLLVVPEPGSLALLVSACGLGSIFARRQRRV